MGEYAEMLLDGTCCEGCGEYMGGGAPGFPRYCKACRARSPSPAPSWRDRHPVRCECGRRFKAVEHQRQHAETLGCKPLDVAAARKETR